MKNKAKKFLQGFLIVTLLFSAAIIVPNIIMDDDPPWLASIVINTNIK